MSEETRNIWDAFESDLEDLLGDTVRSSQEKAEELWGSLANVDWSNPNFQQPYLLYSFRAAGGLVAQIYGRNTMYMDWYCSSEAGFVREWVAEAMKERGWTGKSEIT